MATVHLEHAVCPKCLSPGLDIFDVNSVVMGRCVACSFEARNLGPVAGLRSGSKLAQAIAVERGAASA